ncbi:MAG TPA: phosphoribosylamine--glycine ligase [Chitinophagaceae bacterium]|nr:phosphoribosylamine--glycine ligase [Chitinophagaceae bacterium]
MVNILILGSGGRESALAWKIKQSAQCDKLFIAPGNAGTKNYGENVDLDIKDFEALAAFCKKENIHFVLPGSEELLVAGVADALQSENFPQNLQVLGPNKQAAALEGSKDFAKEFMQKYQIPTASYKTFNKESYEEGIEYIKKHSLPVVLKADGLAAGKGVIIAETHEDALRGFESMIQDAQFGEASAKVVVESFLKGIEVSSFIFTNGKSFFRLANAKDYKRIGEGETGLNTGGMGAVSPVPFMKGEFDEKVLNKVILPTLDGLKKEGIEYKGFIFFGLINVDGEPYVIEYNCRLGDPETEVLMPLLEGDIIEMFQLINKEDEAWKKAELSISSKAAVTIMSVSGGYPEEYEKNKEIHIAETKEESIIFYAGAKEKDGKVFTSGGRVLAVTSLADTLEKALVNSYAQLDKIAFEGQYYRKDIGFEFK